MANVAALSDLASTTAGPSVEMKAVRITDDMDTEDEEDDRIRRSYIYTSKYGWWTYLFCCGRRPHRQLYDSVKDLFGREARSMARRNRNLLQTNVLAIMRRLEIDLDVVSKLESRLKWLVLMLLGLTTLIQGVSNQHMVADSEMARDVVSFISIAFTALSMVIVGLGQRETRQEVNARHAQYQYMYWEITEFFSHGDGYEDDVSENARVARLVKRLRASSFKLTVTLANLSSPSANAPTPGAVTQESERPTPRLRPQPQPLRQPPLGEPDLPSTLRDE